MSLDFPVSHFIMTARSSFSFHALWCPLQANRSCEPRSRILRSPTRRLFLNWPRLAASGAEFNFIIRKHWYATPRFESRMIGRCRLSVLGREAAKS